MISVKVNGKGHKSVLAICDVDLLGKRLSSGKLCLDLEKYRGFYDGLLFDERDGGARAHIRKLLSSSASANVVGKKSVSLLSELGYDIKGAQTIGRVPHLQFYMV